MMDRKKTILVAVLINAGLLVVLFIAALTTEEESASEMSQMSMVHETAQPLFIEPVDLAVKPPPLATAPQLAPPEIPAVVLPPMVLESPPIAAAPSEPVVQASTAESTYVEVTVKKGDSLEKIAKAHNTTVDELIKLNQLSNSFLRIGQVLKIPVGKTVMVATPKIIKPLQSEIASSEFYTVKVGDNPWTIAMKHHMKVEELLKLNSLNEERARKLKPGDRLRIR